MMHFNNWYFLLLMPLALYLIFRKKKRETIKYSNINILKKAGMLKSIKHRIGDIFIAMAICAFIVALARPQIPTSMLPVQGKGIDIVMVLDVSGSMESVDFEPNRLEVARATIKDFVSERFEDRIGLVVFAGTAYTRIPLTLDHQVVQESLSEVSTSSVSEEGTAIGMAISVGVNRLKKSEAQSKIMILVTDGDNNAGAINPETASQLASELGIKVYAIGVGTDETIYPVTYFGQTKYQRLPSGLNEPLLESIADTTGGQYYRALDEKALEEIFEEIDDLERTNFDRDSFQLYDEWAFPFIKIGLLLLLVGMILKRYVYIQIP